MRFAPPHLEQDPPHLMKRQLFMPFRCNKPCSMPFTYSMQDMMVPLATDLCLLALQKLRMQFSLPLNRLKGRLEQVHSCTAVQLLLDDTEVSSDAVPHDTSPIRFGIRELPCIRQDNLAVGNGLGERTPPSVGCGNAAVITCRKNSVSLLRLRS